MTRAVSFASAIAVAAVTAGAFAQGQRSQGSPATPPHNPAGGKVEQTAPGTKPALPVLASFDGLGVGMTGPHGTWTRGNPSDNSLAVGPNHIVQIVNSRVAIFTKKGSKYDTTGTPLYGPVVTNILFKDFGGQCENRSSGDAVVRYDQLADRWLFVLPVFQRGPVRSDQAEPAKGGDPAQVSVPGRADQPGAAMPLFVPPPPPPEPPTPPTPPARGAGAGAARGATPPGPQGPYSMCYAVSTSNDPMGSYYRYEFLRPLFPDYPRPAIWPDGYYVPSSTSDNRISETVATQKHACVADRTRMLKGQPATEQCVIVENVSFLNNADIDGKSEPPHGAPNIMMAAGGRQLDQIFDDDTISTWEFRVDWKTPANTHVVGPTKVSVAPYHFLCDGQLTSCVPQAGTDRRLDAQGDKLMQRLVYRRVNGHESIFATHSINTEAGAGGVRWYEFRVNRDLQESNQGKEAVVKVTLYQQGTYAPEGNYRWMASGGIDRRGNIGIGYSYGAPDGFAGQRFAARLADDPLGLLTFHESTLATGEAPQTTTVRWEDYTTLAMDPSDDCTFWYVGDYLKKDATTYSSKIGSFQIPGCR
jgi:hypothetical protein